MQHHWLKLKNEAHIVANFSEFSSIWCNHSINRFTNWTPWASLSGRCGSPRFELVNKLKVSLDI